MRRDKKDDEAGAGNPYDHLDKATVVQEVFYIFENFKKWNLDESI